MGLGIGISGPNGSEPCDDANIVNSNGTYDVDVAAGGTLTLPDINNVDSDGSTVVTPAQTPFVASPALDANITNSDSSYNQAVASGATLTLPDISNIDSDGSVVVTPAQTPFVATACSGGGGGAVGAALMKTNQTVSLRTGDDGDLEKGRLVDFFTLSDLNGFGTTDRFTDINGAQLYPDNIVIDWSTFDGTSVLGYARNFQQGNWDTAIDDSLTFSAGSYTSGWRLANIREMANLADYSYWNTMLYAPFNVSGYQVFYTSTAQPTSSTRCLIFRNYDGEIDGSGKTSTYEYMPVRNFTPAELGFVYPPEGGWKRNPDWLPMPTINPSDFSMNQLIAVSQTTGGSTAVIWNRPGSVDWGDGNISTIGTNIYTTHEYDFNTLPASTEFVKDGVTYRQAMVQVTSTGTNQNGNIGYCYNPSGVSYSSHSALDIEINYPASTNVYNITTAKQVLCERINFTTTPIFGIRVDQLLNNVAPNLRTTNLPLDNQAYGGQISYLSIESLPNITLQPNAIYSNPVNSNYRYLTLLKTAGTYTGTAVGAFRYQNCGSLETIGDVNLISSLPSPNNPEISFFAQDCHALRGTVNITMTGNNNSMRAFKHCFSVEEINLMGNATPSFAMEMFYFCYSLRKVHFDDASVCNSTSNMFSQCLSLADLRIPGFPITIDLRQTSLDIDAMVVVFNDLKDLTGLAGQTIYVANIVKNNMTQAQKDIALNKNWTIG